MQPQVYENADRPSGGYNLTAKHDGPLAFGEKLSGRELVMKVRLHQMTDNPLVAMVELRGQQTGWNGFVGVIEPSGSGNEPLLARALGPPPPPLPHMGQRKQVDYFVHLRLANGNWHDYVGVIEPQADVHPDRR